MTRLQTLVGALAGLALVLATPVLVTTAAADSARGPVTLRNEGTRLGEVDVLDCVGAGVSCTRSGRVGTMTIAGGGVGTGGHSIQEEGGAALTARTNLNFVGGAITATDDAVNDQTDVTVVASGTGACAANTFASTLNNGAAPTCTQPAFSDLSGAATDAQVPNTITVDLSAAATALAANPTDCAATQFANAIAASGNLTCAALADADIPNTITVDLASAATALAANPADCSAGQYATTIAASGALTCAQPSFSQLSGTASIAQGGTTETASTEDAVLVGASTTDWAPAVLPSCSNATTSKLLYNSTTNAFSCGTDQDTGGGGGAPSTATYITQTADATLSNEQAMGSLGTGLVKNTTTTGVQSIYAGTSCTNQFPRSLDGSGAATCASVSMANDVTGTLALGNGGTGQTTATAAFNALSPTTTGGDISYHNGTDDVRLAKGTAGQVLTMNAGATAPEWAAAGAGSAGETYYRVSANVDNATTTFSDVTGLTWSVAANTNYAWTCHLIVGVTTGTGNYVSAINGPASPTLSHAFYTSHEGSTEPANKTTYAMGATTTTYNQTGYTLIFSTNDKVGLLVSGSFENGANSGTFAIRMKASAASTTARTYQGSWCVVHTF